MAEGDSGLVEPPRELTDTAKRVRRALLLLGIPDHAADEATVSVFRSLAAPDNRMLKAAARAMSPDRRPTQRSVSVKAKHAIRYRAMILAAIGEKLQPSRLAPSMKRENTDG